MRLARDSRRKALEPADPARIAKLLAGLIAHTLAGMTADRRWQATLSTPTGAALTKCSLLATVDVD